MGCHWSPTRTHSASRLWAGHSLDCFESFSPQLPGLPPVEEEIAVLEEVWWRQREEESLLGDEVM